MTSTATDITADQPWRPRDTFSARLRLVRHEKRLTVEEAADACGIPHPTWSTWEHGAMPRNMAEVVHKIVLALNVERDWLIWGGDLLPSSTKWLLADDETAGQPLLYAIGQAHLPGIS